MIILWPVRGVSEMVNMENGSMWLIADSLVTSMSVSDITGWLVSNLLKFYEILLLLVVKAAKLTHYHKRGAADTKE